MTATHSGTLRKVVWRVLGNFYGKGIGFVATALIARWMGPSEYGHVRIVLSLFSIFLVFSGYQLKTAISTYVAQYPDQRRNLYAHGMGMMTVAFLLSLLGFTVALGLFNPVNDLAARSLFLISFPAIVAYQLGDVWKDFLQGIGRVRAQTLQDMLGGTLKAGFILAFVWWVGTTAPYWLAGRILGEVVALTVLGVFMAGVFRTVFAGQTVTRDRMWIHRYAGYYGYGILGSGLSSIQNELPALLSMWFTADSSQVAFVGVALLFLSALGMFGQSLTSAVYAEAARLHLDKPALLRHLGRSQRLGNLIFVPVAIALIVFTPFIVRSVFGAQYLPSIALVRIVLAASVFQNVSFINGGYWLAVGNIRLTTITSGIFFVFSAAASIIGMMTAGALGMAWGILISRALISVATVELSRRWIV